jgi:CopG family transcriptional regulator/antitoxin EndoAI
MFYQQSAAARARAGLRSAAHPAPACGRRFKRFDVHTNSVYTAGRTSAFEETLMTKRINIVLPVETIKVLDRVAPKGSRSRLISVAVLHYVGSRAKSNLAERLKAGALANAKRDLEIAQEWFSLDQEAWQRTKPAKRPAR